MVKKRILTMTMLAALVIPVLARAEYFVVMRDGKVRAGPGIDHPVVGAVKASEVFEIPASFRSRWNIKWIPIASGQVPDTIKVRGWHQIMTHTEYVESGEIVEGWYLVGLENLRTVEPGQTVVFIMNDDTEKLYYGEIVVNLFGEKTIGGLLYKNAKFRLTKRIPMEVEVQPETGRFIWFYRDSCEGKVSAGTLLERLPERKTCRAETYELGLFEVKPSLETSYTKWVPVSLGERVAEADLAHKLYRIRKSGFPLSVQKDILDHRIWLGMTKEMARLSWGEPSWASTTRSAKGPREQWVYDYGRTTYYLHFVDGLLDSYRKAGRARGR